MHRAGVERVHTGVWARLRRLGGMARREERTTNMESMSKTRVVFQLSGWSKAIASCAEGRKQRHTVQGGLVMRPGGMRRRRQPRCARAAFAARIERARLYR